MKTDNELWSEAVALGDCDPIESATWYSVLKDQDIRKRTNGRNELYKGQRLTGVIIAVCIIAVAIGSVALGYLLGVLFF